MKQDRLMLLQFILPAVQITACCLAIGSNPRDVPIAIYNEDNYMGFKYLRHIDNQTIHQLSVGSLQEGVDLVVNGEAAAVIHIRKNFTNALMERFTTRGNVSQNAVRASKVYLRQDTTSQQINFYVNLALMDALAALSKDVLGNVKKYPQLVNFLLEIGDPIYRTNNKFISRDLICSAFLLAMIYINAIGMTSLQLIIDRKEELYDRSLVSGVTTFEIIFGYVLTHVGFLVLQAGIFIIFAQQVFKMYISGSILLVMILIVLQGMCGISLGFLISTVCDNGSQAQMLSTLLFFPGMSFGGLMWTSLSMQGFLLKISYAFPHTLAAESIRWIVFRGKDMLWTNVWSGFLSTIVWIAIFIFISVFVMRYRQL